MTTIEALEEIVRLADEASRAIVVGRRVDAHRFVAELSAIAQDQLVNNKE